MSAPSPTLVRELLVRDIASVLNRHGMEKFSNTPDFILAEHLVQALEAFNATSTERERWYGKALSIGGTVDLSLVGPPPGAPES